MEGGPRLDFSLRGYSSREGVMSLRLPFFQPRKDYLVSG